MQAGNQPFSPIVSPFERELDKQKGCAKQHCQYQKHDYRRLALAGLSRIDCQSHRQAAADQHSRIGSSESHVQEMTALNERFQMQRAIDDVRHENAAEEHDFGGQEHPHTEASSIVLLLLGLELMHQGRRMSDGMSHISQEFASLLCSCRLLRLPQEFSRHFPSAS